MNTNYTPTISILHQNCKPDDDNNSKLPYTAYLTWYKVDDNIQYDIAMADKSSELFDYYYDNYQKNFIGMQQSKGMIAPNRWNVAAVPPKKRKKRKRKEEPNE